MIRRILLPAILAVCVLSQTLPAAGNEPILIGYGADAKWSPGDKSVSFVKRDTLFVKNLDTKTEAIPVFSGPIARYEWLDDSTFAVQTRVLTEISGGNLQVDRILRVPLHGLPQEIEKDSINIWAERGKELMLRKYANGSVGYDFNRGLEKESEILAIGQKTPGSLGDNARLFVATVPAGWGKVWLYYGSEKSGRQITQTANTYLLPQLAPTGDKFLCGNHRGELLVYDTLDHELGNLGRGDMQDWDPTGQYVIYCRSQYSEFDIKAADIFVSKFDGTETRQITNTSDKIEVDPQFSPLGRWILFRNYRTAAIYAVDSK